MLKLLGALLALVLALLASTLSPWAAMGQAALLALLLLCLLALAMRPRSGVARADGAARADRHALAVIAENAGMMSSFTRVVAASREQQTLLAGLREGVDVLADSVRTVVQSADITHDEVSTMHGLARQGDESLRRTAERIEALAQSAGALDARFREVMRHTQEIKGLLAVIQNVTMQTNLLSLNAAVEAARAGEHGRGFAVVADEVRKLAVRTGEATQQIQQTISGITASAAAADEHLKTVLEGVNESVQRTRETGEALADIRERSGRTLQAATAMASAAQAQDATSERLMQDAGQLASAAGQSLEWVGKSNAQLRVVQALIGELKQETSALLTDHRAVDVPIDCIEEMRACNILVMNSGAPAELEPVIRRIAQLDGRLDAAWEHWQAGPGSRHQAATAAAAFTAAVGHYRAVRGEALALARAGRFEEVRRKIPTDVRQAYDGARQTLAQIDTQDKALRDRRGRLPLGGRRLVSAS